MALRTCLKAYSRLLLTYEKEKSGHSSEYQRAFADLCNVLITLVSKSSHKQ
jgi:hypothetical protein